MRQGYKKAIQKNNSPILAELREQVRKSIRNVEISTNSLWSFGKLQQSGGADAAAVRADIYSIGRKSGDELDKLKSLANEEAQLPILANWRSEPLTTQFYAGLEAADVTGFSENANVKAGMLVYLRPGKKLTESRDEIMDCVSKKEKKDCSSIRLSFWPHWFLKADYSSAGEVSQGNPDDAGQGGDPVDESQPGVDTAVEWESGIFWPVYYGARQGFNQDGEVNPLKSEMMIGPIYSRGARKISGENFQNRSYWGARVAFNEETYFDVLYGRSEGVKDADGNLNDRWEIRAQYPVSKFGLGRVFVGGNVNFGHRDKDIPVNKDSYGVYVMWQTRFDDLWSGAKSKE